MTTMREMIEIVCNNLIGDFKESKFERHDSFNKHSSRIMAWTRENGELDYIECSITPDPDLLPNEESYGVGFRAYKRCGDDYINITTSPVPADEAKELMEMRDW